jgi:hypothetical protein
MNRYHPAALTLVTCAASLSLAACSAGITAAAPAASSPAASPSHSASRPAAGSSRSPNTVSVGGSIGRFPIPPGAKVFENATDNKGIVVLLSSVTPAQVYSFYTSALRSAGYKITFNTMATANNNTGAEIEFTGHGYKGTISADSNLATPGASVSGTPTKNFAGITLTPR